MRMVMTAATEAAIHTRTHTYSPQYTHTHANQSIKSTNKPPHLLLPRGHNRLEERLHLRVPPRHPLGVVRVERRHARGPDDVAPAPGGEARVESAGVVGEERAVQRLGRAPPLSCDVVLGVVVCVWKVRCACM